MLSDSNAEVTPALANPLPNPATDNGNAYYPLLMLSFPVNLNDVLIWIKLLISTTAVRKKLTLVLDANVFTGINN